jgi:hypothetical protein
MKLGHRGQALIEVAISVSLFMIVFGWAARFFQAEYRRLLCEKLLFEKTRSYLNSPETKPLPPLLNEGVRLTQSGANVRGDLPCGSLNLSLKLKALEQWD